MFEFGFKVLTSLQQTQLTFTGICLVVISPLDGGLQQEADVDKPHIIPIIWDRSLLCVQSVLSSVVCINHPPAQIFTARMGVRLVTCVILRSRTLTWEPSVDVFVFVYSYYNNVVIYRDLFLPCATLSTSRTPLSGWMLLTA